MLIEATTQTTLGPVYILTGNDDLHVGTGVQIQSTYSDPVTHTGADAVTTWIGTHTITVDGTIIGEDEAINTVGCEETQTIIVNAGGVLIGGGDGIVTEADGIILDGLNSSFTNAGTVDAYGSGAQVIVRDGGTTTVTNSGTMTANIAGVWHKFGLGTLVFTNSGTVESLVDAFRGGDSGDHVFNSGSLIGDVLLGGGADLYDGRGGTVDGVINGGDGDDRFLLSNAHETLDGGAGFDTIDLSFATKQVRVNFAAPANNGGIQIMGDSVTGFEAAIGGTKGDYLTGDDQANRFDGMGGSDIISTGAGADTLIGGLGVDYLTGGDGADCFEFLSRNGIGDVIYDFAAGTDQICIEGSAFGYGAATGVLSAADFVSGTAPVAGDLTDHFLFRTTDSTLWYDIDGSKSKAPVLLANLQDGVVITAADIWLI